MRYKIYLDAGHGKHTPNKVSPTGISEWQLNNDVCNYIKNNLAKYNCDVFRCDDTTGETDPTPVSTRLHAAEIGGADVCISIHHSIAKDGTFESGKDYSGVEVYISKQYTSLSKELGFEILNNLVVNTRLKNRGLKMSNMTMTTPKPFPTVIVEGGCINNENDLAYVCSEKGKKAYAKAISSSLISLFNLSKDDEDSGVGEGKPMLVYTVKEFSPIEKQVGEKHTVLASAISECDKHVGAKVVDENNNVVHESTKSTPVVENKHVMVNNTRGTKMRKNSSSSAVIITNLTYRTKLILVSKTTPSWWKCRTLNGRYEGYVYANTLKEVQ